MTLTTFKLSKLHDAINKACPAFAKSFSSRCRYKVEYGGAGSGKSHAIARRLAFRFINEGCTDRGVTHNILVVRKVNRTLKKSCFKLVSNILKKWCRKKSFPFQISDFAFNTTELTITHKESGSMFLFSGMDDPEKIKSIEAITTIWAEEATELTQEDFEQLDLRLRGEHGCVKEFWVSFNPISDQNWVKKVFFDSGMASVHINKTTYLDNQFIDDEYKTVLENKRKTNPRYYNIYALGNWGTAEGLIFNNITYRLIKQDDIDRAECLQGLDFGYTNDPTAFNQTYIDTKAKRIFVYDGFYEKGMSNSAIASKLIGMKAHKHMTTCDSAEPKSIDSLKAKGCRVQSAKKGKDSINNGIDFLQDYEIVINAHLVEFKTEAENYAWAVDKNGKPTNKPVDEFNHFFDSLRYATEKYHSKGKAARLNIGY